MLNLTLTRVVFEYIMGAIFHAPLYLTLTRVVFESATKSTLFTVTPVFNFNKSCIWINALHFYHIYFLQFNFNKSCIWISYLHLPYDLARQFNFNKSCIWIYNIFLYSCILLKFNFNKSCIWMCLYTYLKGTQWI